MVGGHCVEIPGRVVAPHPAHERFEHPVTVAGEIAADRAPAVAAVVRAPKALAGVVQAGRRVGADQDRRVPVPALRRVARLGLRLDVDVLAGGAVVADEVALLPLAVGDVGVAGLGGGLVAVGTERDVPVVVADAVDGVGARRAALCRVVLGAAVDVVEGLGVVDGHLVELGDREVGDEAPGGREVEALVEPAVGADEQVVGVVGVEGEGVVVGVLVLLGEPTERGATVVGDLDAPVHEVDAVEGVGARHELLVVVRAGGARHRLGHLRPARAAVGRAPDAASAPIELDRGVEDVGLLGRDREPDLAEGAFGQALRQPPPAEAAVGRGVDAGLRPAVDQGGHRSVVLPGGGIETVGVPRVHDQVGHAGPLAAAEDLGPGGPAVGRTEEAAVAARRPQRALAGDENHIGVPGVDQDACDVLGVVEAAVLPAPAAVGAAVQAVAEADVAAADVLAGAHPDHVGVARVEGDAADRVGALVVEDRGPGRAAVGGLPDAP